MDFPPFHLRIDIGNLGDNMYRMDTYICSAGGVGWGGVVCLNLSPCLHEFYILI